MKVTPSRLYAIAVVFAATVLHAYESLVLAEQFLLGFFLWAMVPYGVCMVVFAAAKSGVPSASGVSAALLLDVATHYSVFIAPESSTAALGMLVVPAWSAGFVAPGVMLVAWAIQWQRRRHLRELALERGPIEPHL